MDTRRAGNTAIPKHFLHVFATFGVGGPQVRTCEMLNHFGAKYSHTIIAMDGNVEAKSRLSDGLAVDFMTLDFDKRNTWGNVLLFRRTLRKLMPDLLLTYNWGAIEWAMANYVRPVCPHIHLERGFNQDEIVDQKQRRILLRRFFLARSCKIVVPSARLQEIALEIWKLNPSRVEYIPNGIDCEWFMHEKIESAGREEIIIGTVAGLREVKNIPRLVRVFSRFLNEHPCRLWIVGDGPEYDNIMQLITELKLADRIRLWGHTDNPAELLKQFDIFAISSDTEQMPNSVLEAMAAGLPIVGTDVGDIKHMVATQNKAFIVEKTDEDSFFQGLQRLINNPPLRKILGTENRTKCVQFYSNEVMFANYERLFESALASKTMQKK